MSSLKSIQAPAMPKLICTGRVKRVVEDKAGITKKETYCMVPIELEADGAGKDTTVYFLFRPEWLSPEFDPNTIEKDFGPNVDFVYRNNIQDVTRGGEVSTLEGLAGSAEAANILKSNLASLGEVTVDGVVKVFVDFFNDNPSTKLGFTLTQRMDKIEDEDGNVEKMRVKGYNLDRFFYPTEDNLKRKRNYAEKSDGKQIFTSDIPF